MSPMRLAACALMLTTVAAVPGRSMAQDRPGPSAGLKPAQRDGERKALAAFAAGRYEDALNTYAELYADYRDPIYLRNIGRCQTKLQNPDKAIASFEEYLRTYKRITPRERDQVQSWIRDLKTQPRSPAPAASGASATEGPPPSPASEPSLVAVSRSPGHERARTAGVVASVIGAAAVATGAVILGLAWGKYGSADGKCGAVPGDCARAGDSIDTRNKLAAAFLIGGAVVGATGATLLVLYPVSRPDNATAVNGLGVGAAFAY